MKKETGRVPNNTMANMEIVKVKVNNANEDIQAVRLMCLQNGDAEEMYELLDTAKNAIEDAMTELESELPDTI